MAGWLLLLFVAVVFAADDFLAEGDAFVADEDRAWPGDEALDLILMLAAEGATEAGAGGGSLWHVALLVWGVVSYQYLPMIWLLW